MKICLRIVVCFALSLGLLAGCAGNNAGVPDSSSFRESSEIAVGAIMLNNTGTYTYLPWNATCTSTTNGANPYAIYDLYTADGSTKITNIGYSVNYSTYPLTIPNSYPMNYYRLVVTQYAYDTSSPYSIRQVGTDWCYVIDTTN